MATKIFITGITGYIGGDALYALNQAHPEYEYSGLVRSKHDAERIKAAYPKLRIVLGGLDDSDLLKQEASRADIVLHTADSSDHEGAAKAIAAGLIAGHSATKPGFWLHTGGTGILTHDDTSSGRLGEWSTKVYNDGDGVDELTTLPDEAFHRNIDKIVLEAGTQHRDAVKTAIVCPPTIYGHGRGPKSGRGRQVYALGRLILQKGYAPIIGPGKARWNNVHVHDLSDAFVLLADAAAAGNLSAEIWGPRGYHIVENGVHTWGDLARTMAAKARELGFISADGGEQLLSKDEAVKIAGFEALSWALNSIARAERLRNTVGWRPRARTLEEDIPDILKAEHERLKKD